MVRRYTDEEKDNDWAAFNSYMPFDGCAADLNSHIEYPGKVCFRPEACAVYVGLAVLAKRV